MFQTVGPSSGDEIKNLNVLCTVLKTQNYKMSAYYYYKGLLVRQYATQKHKLPQPAKHFTCDEHPTQGQGCGMREYLEIKALFGSITNIIEDGRLDVRIFQVVVVPEGKMPGTHVVTPCGLEVARNLGEL
jgi:hypothetical protein